MTTQWSLATRLGWLSSYQPVALPFYFCHHWHFVLVFFPILGNVWNLITWHFGGSRLTRESTPALWRPRLELPKNTELHLSVTLSGAERNPVLHKSVFVHCCIFLHLHAYCPHVHTHLFLGNYLFQGDGNYPVKLQLMCDFILIWFRAPFWLFLSAVSMQGHCG